MAFKQEVIIHSTELIHLQEKDLIGTGTRRFCYAHPSESSLCIKIPKAKKNGIKQQNREVKFYQQLTSRGVPTVRITHYHGEVETSLGRGYVYDVIRDVNGNPSQPFGAYIKNDPSRSAEYIQMLKTLEDYLFDNSVVFYDLNVWNILCKEKEDGSLEPFIIDGVGDVVAIPVLNLSKRLLNQKIKRRWLRLISKMKKNYPWMTAYTFSRS